MKVELSVAVFTSVVLSSLVTCSPLYASGQRDRTSDQWLELLNQGYKPRDTLTTQVQDTVHLTNAQVQEMARFLSQHQTGYSPSDLATLVNKINSVSSQSEQTPGGYFDVNSVSNQAGPQPGQSYAQQLIRDIHAQQKPEINTQSSSYADSLVPQVPSDIYVEQVPNNDVQSASYADSLVPQVPSDLYVEQVPKNDVQSASYADSLVPQVPSDLYVEQVPNNNVQSASYADSLVPQVPSDAPASYIDVAATDAPASYIDVVATDAPANYIDATATDAPASYIDVAATDAPANYIDVAATDAPASYIDVAATDAPASYIGVAATDAPASYINMAATDAPASYIDIAATDAPATYVKDTKPVYYDEAQDYDKSTGSYKEVEFYQDDKEEKIPNKVYDSKHDGTSDVHDDKPSYQTSVVIADIKTPTLDLCGQCEEIHGLGYAPVAGLCDAYLQCVYRRGEATQVHVKRCPAGTLWNQELLVCDFPEAVDCVPGPVPSHSGPCPTRHGDLEDVTVYHEYYNYQWNRLNCAHGMAYNNDTCQCSDKLVTQKDIRDKQCADKSDECETYASRRGGRQQYCERPWARRNCRHFCGLCGASSNCEDKDMKAIPGDVTAYMQKVHDIYVRMPCPATLTFNPQSCTCEYPVPAETYMSPTATTISTSTPETNQCGNMAAVPGDSSAYMQMVNGVWLRMPCPATLVFDTTLCRCDFPQAGAVVTSPVMPVADDCKPTLKITFDDDVSDSSPNRFWVNNIGVKVENGQGYFDGKSKLTVPALSNMELGDSLCILVRYRQTLPVTMSQTLLSNGDCGYNCGDTQSVGVCSGPEHVDFYAETDGQVTPAHVSITKDVGEWQFAKMVLHQNSLHGFSYGDTNSTVVEGNIERRHRGLVIGAGGPCKNFQGVMDEVSVYKCMPNL